MSVRALDGNQVVDEALPIYFMSVGNIDHAIYHLNLSMTDKRRQDLFKIIGCDATVIYGKSSVCSKIIKEGLVWLSLNFNLNLAEIGLVLVTFFSELFFLLVFELFFLLVFETTSIFKTYVYF